MELHQALTHFVDQTRCFGTTHEQSLKREGQPKHWALHQLSFYVSMAQFRDNRAGYGCATPERCRFTTRLTDSRAYIWVMAFLGPGLDLFLYFWEHRLGGFWCCSISMFGIILLELWHFFR